ncbi:MAG: response regulator transcription factor [Hyphomicrobiaceae bacterium]
MTANKILIVDDHPLFRGALSQALTAAFEQTEIVELGSLDELTTTLNDSQKADLVLLDLSMPGVQGLSGLLFLRAQFPQIPVVIVSAREDAATIRRCIEFGASGFVPKSKPVDQIRNAIRKVLDGEIWTPPDLDLSSTSDSGDGDLIQRLSNLTPQQVRVLMMLGEGLLNKQIAFNLNVSEATIKAHVSAILQKLGVDSRTQAVIAVNRINAGDWQQMISN